MDQLKWGVCGIRAFALFRAETEKGLREYIGHIAMKNLCTLLRHSTFLGLVCVTVAMSSPAWAAEKNILSDKDLAKKECGACHYFFSREFLPAFSWKKIIDTLDNHFGEDASLNEETRKRILTYMAAGRATEIPMRVTETGWWKQAHGASWKRLAAQGNVNVSECGNCHRPDN
ncbi:MAG: hypothetical protein JKY17_06365 [Magnetovibrio sp.]|nr:hypothetical protein [Magnetovibrio sp.]